MKKMQYNLIHGFHLDKDIIPNKKGEAIVNDERWHPFTELPPNPPSDDSVEYLIAVDSGEGYVDYDLAEFGWSYYPNGEKKAEWLVIGNDWYEGQDWGIIAWMELPPLPIIAVENNKN